MKTRTLNLPGPAPPLRWPALWLARLGLLAAFVLLWAWAASRVPAFILPGPRRVGQALATLLTAPGFWNEVGVTCYRVLAGFGLAAVVGAPLGLALGASRGLASVFEPVLAVLNTVSSAIWAVFAIIWFGLSNGATVFVVFMTAMPLILTNVWQGARNVDPQLLELTRTLGFSRLRTLWRVHLPAILPYFFSGARLAFGFGWRVSLVAETLGASDGIGYRLRQAADLVQTDQVFAWTLLLVALMLALETGVLKPLERHLFRWQSS